MQLWWLPVCIIVGLVYAWLLYRKETTISEFWKKIAFGLRAIAVSIIAMLLIGLMSTVTHRFEEKPIIVFAVDNSASISKVLPKQKLQETINQINNTEKSLQNKYETKIITLSDSQNNIAFTEKTSNLDQLLQNVANKYENRNVKGVILISDGIINEGVSPLYQQYTFPIHTLSIGDTTIRKDFAIKQVLHNKTANINSQFPIKVFIKQKGFTNKTIDLQLLENGKVVQTQQINLNDNIIEHTFICKESQKGIKRYTISTKAFDNESNKENNTKDIFIKIGDEDKKVLIIASAPHPDIKALKLAFRSKDHLKFESYFIGDNESVLSQQYDLVIVHGLPNQTISLPNSVLGILQNQTPKLFIASNQTNWQSLGQLNNCIQALNYTKSRLDNVSINSSFNLFSIDNELINLVNQLPPLNSSAKLKPKAGASVALQNNTQQPIITFNLQQKPAQAFISGEGLWRWRMEAMAMNSNADLIDNFLEKTIQILTQAQQKERFNINLLSDEIFENNFTIAEAEIWNSQNEAIYDKEVKLQLTYPKGKKETFSFTHQLGAVGFQLPVKDAGVYKFTASTDVDGKTLTTNGEFAVIKQDKETADLEANFGLLKELSNKTNGQYESINNISKLEKYLNEANYSNQLRSNDEVLEWINIYWFLIAILILLSAEWFIRKMEGSY